MSEPLRLVRPEAVQALSEEIVQTGRLPSGWLELTDHLPLEADLDLIEDIASRAARTLDPLAEMDSWLAPRLHCALRIPRRIAAEPGLWVWLAFVCREYVEARHAKADGAMHPWRYQTGWSRNALARLWWGAEMARNGPSYRDVAYCFARTRTAQFALELMYSLSRPAAIAFVRVAEGADGGNTLTDVEMRALSTRLKIYFSLHSLDAAATAPANDPEEFDPLWAAHSPSLTELLDPDVMSLKGPARGLCAESTIMELVSWFRAVSRIKVMPGAG